MLARLLVLATLLMLLSSTRAFCSRQLAATSSSRSRSSLKMASLYDFTLKDMAGADVSFAKYKNKPTLLLNVASL